jgi:eukaryotic-like serine/threonine-protein kinase
MESPRIYRYPNWSPDGETIVFSTFGPAENLYLIGADGSSYRQVTDDSHRNRGPRWFPDGSRLLFYSTRNGTYQAWSIRPDGSNPQQLTETPASVVRPVLSRSADRIAYRPSLSMRWSIAELRSPGEERVTDMPPAPGGANPAPNSWSRDGSRLALFEDRPGTAEPRMFVYDIAAMQYRPLQVTGSNPSWLPDDRRLLFTTRTGVSLIDTLTGRTREVHKLAADLDAQSGGFAISADGRRMALLVLNEKSDLWMMAFRPPPARN